MSSNDEIVQVEEATIASVITIEEESAVEVFIEDPSVEVIEVITEAE